MKINLDVAALKTSEKESTRGLKHHCRTSLPRLLLAALALFVVTLTLYLCKRYIRAVLYWLENQDSVVVSATIVILFVVVSFPLSVGYIVVVGASGYLFGLLRGFVLSVIGANVGLVMAHNVLKLVGHHEKVRRLIERDTAAAIVRVISGPLCFKIVFCSRLTPIPFGLQNAIFALSDVDAKVYHLASLIGLLAGQFVGAYVGSTLRSMQDVLENRHFSTGTYMFAGSQIVLAAALIVWFGAKARVELLRAISDAESKLPGRERLLTGYNVV